MRGLSLNRVFALLLLASPVLGQDPFWSEELALQRGREAYFHKRYTESLDLFIQVLQENPDQPEAKRMIKEAAEAASSAEVRQVQQERGRILSEAEALKRRAGPRRASPPGLPFTGGEQVAAWEGKGEGALENGESREEAAAQGASLFDRQSLRPESGAPEAPAESAQEPGFSKAVLLEKASPLDKGVSPRRAEPPAPRLERSILGREVSGLYQAGLVSYSRGRLPEAAKAWERALDLDPGNEKARKALARARKDLEVQARQEAERPYALADALNGSQMRDGLASSPRPKGARERLADQPEQAVELYRSGLILYGNGKVREASAEWERALRIMPEDERVQKALARARRELEVVP